MTIDEYKTFEQLTIADLEFLSQVFTRLRAEGYDACWDFGDFVDVIAGRNGVFGDHRIIPTVESELLAGLRS